MKPIIIFLIKTFLPGYSLHRNPPKGARRPRKKASNIYPLPLE